MDGVKIIADAIRKEKAEKLNTMQPTAPVNVSDVTAQFTGKVVENTKDTTKEQETKDNTTKEQETRKEETNNDDIN